MPFKKGKSGNPDGKPKGAVSESTKLMRSVRDVVLSAFNAIQEDKDANIVTWGKKNPKDFYAIAAKLIPTEISAKMDVTTNTPLISWVTPSDDKPE